MHRRFEQEVISFSLCLVCLPFASFIFFKWTHAVLSLCWHIAAIRSKDKVPVHTHWFDWGRYNPPVSIERKFWSKGALSGHCVHMKHFYIIQTFIPVISVLVIMANDWAVSRYGANVIYLTLLRIVSELLSYYKCINTGHFITSCYYQLDFLLLSALL